MNWVDDVVAFWFETLRPADWWRAAPALDRDIRARFGALHRRLSAGPTVPHGDPDGPDGAGAPAAAAARAVLAMVLVLDQFSRHLDRGTADAYVNDAAALAVALDAIDRGLDALLTVPQRHFLYMPLMHSEDPAMQDRSVALFDALGDPRASHSAHDHRDTIARFGRFPARNEALGRPSTDAERAWLADRRPPRRR